MWPKLGWARKMSLYSLLGPRRQSGGGTTSPKKFDNFISRGRHTITSFPIESLCVSDLIYRMAVSFPLFQLNEFWRCGTSQGGGWWELRELLEQNRLFCQIFASFWHNQHAVDICCEMRHNMELLRVETKYVLTDFRTAFCYLYASHLKTSKCGRHAS